MRTEALSFENLTGDRIARITEACTLCGKCFEACPMVPYSPAKGAEPEAVVRSVIDLLNGRPHAPAGAAWAEACQKSGVCIEACPEDVNPREMLLYAKLKLQREKQGPEERAGVSRDYFQILSRTIRLMSAIQLEPGLWRRLTAVRGGKKQGTEAVFYFGCNILQTPHILLSCLDVFDRLGLDYEVAGGVGHCCGVNPIRRGDLEAGAAMGAKSLGHFRSYNPGRVITFCPTCQMQYTEYMPLYASAGLRLAGGHGADGAGEALAFVHITQYLAENVDRLRALFVRPVRKRAAVHLHGGVPGVERNLRKVLAAVPGLEVAEIDQLSSHGYQCPTLVLPEAKAAMRERLLASARAAGVDSLLTVYHSCHRELCGEEGSGHFRVENFMSILGEAMGFEYPDWTKTFKLYEDMDRVLAEADGLLRAHGIEPEGAREALQAALYGAPRPAARARGGGAPPAMARIGIDTAPIS
ncbi:MAG: (Fe-S)-binding protein, partial [Nitrospinota bacterium]